MEFWKAVAIRAVRTMAQGAVVLIGTNIVNIVDIDWPQILGCVATMGVMSILMSLAGLPEVDQVEAEVIQYDDEGYADDVKEITEEEGKRMEKAEG